MKVEYFFNPKSLNFMKKKFSKLNTALFQDENIKKDVLNKFVGGREEGHTVTASVTYSGSGWDSNADYDTSF